MLYLTKPESFHPKFEVVGCFIEYQKEILLLLRQDHCSEPNTYGIPSGKVEKNEDRDQAIIREILEETGLKLKDLDYFKKTYVQYPDFDFVYHMYHKSLKEKAQIKINPREHKDFLRISPKEALKENLIQDGDICIKMFYKL